MLLCSKYQISPQKQSMKQKNRRKKGTRTYGSQETLLRLLLILSPVDKGLVLLRRIVCTIRFTERLSLAPVVACKAFRKQYWLQKAKALANLSMFSSSDLCHTIFKAVLTQEMVGRADNRITSVRRSSFSAICCSVVME